MYATGYLSGGLLSHCLDVIPGKEEKDKDDNRDWSSDVASNLSMAVMTEQTPPSAWLEEMKPLPSQPERRDTKLARRLHKLQPRKKREKKLSKRRLKLR